MEVSAKLLNPKFKPIEIKIVIENEDEKNEYINYMNGKLTKMPKSVENLFSKRKFKEAFLKDKILFYFSWKYMCISIYSK